MKGFAIESWVKVNRLTAGRRAYAARRMAVAAEGAGYADVAAMCAEVAATEGELLDLEREYRRGKVAATAGTWTPEVLAEDAVLDRGLVRLRDLLAALAALKGSTRGDAAKVLLDEGFPEGVTYYTHAAIEDEAARVASLLAAFDARGPQVASATVGELVEDVRASHQRYQAALDAVQAQDRVAYASVRELDLRNQRRLLEIVVAALAATSGLPEPDRTTQRELLLGPVAAQDAAVTELIRRKRRVADVNPETGEPEPDLGEPEA